MEAPGSVSRVLRQTARRLVVLLMAASIVAALAVPLTALGRELTTAPPVASSAAARARPLPSLSAAPTAAPRPELAAVQTTLQRHSAALMTRDRAAYLADVAPSFQDTQAAQFDNLTDVPLASYAYVLDVALPTTDPRFAAYGGQVLGIRVTLEYAIAGIDSAPDTRSQSLTFVASADVPGAWLLAADSDYDTLGAPSWHGLWDYGPVVVHTSDSGVLLAHPDQEDALPGLADAVTTALAAVTATWGPTTPPRILVLLPDSSAELQTVGAVTIPLEQLAAVAVAGTVDYDAQTATGQRVLLNPDTLVQLGPRATLALLAHEITHIATRTTTRPGTPMWLVEGFADLVGFDAVGAGPREAAAELGAQVQAGQVPTTLPADAAFVSDTPAIDGVYAQSWLACRLLASKLGLPGFVALYREVAASTSPDTTLWDRLQSTLGLTYDQFVAAWSADLVAELA